MLRPKDLCQGSGTKTFLDAMNGGKVHLARFVLDALDGRIINARAEGGRTLLMNATCLQDHAIRAKFTHLLLEKGADVNVQDEYGRTALSLVCELGHLDAVKTLVQFNADPELTDSCGNSALMYAAYGGHSQVLEFLVRAFKRLGLKLDRTNHAGHSATQVADYLGHTQCVQVLSAAGRKGVCSIEQAEETGREGQGEAARPNRLPQQILERFSKQTHSKNEEALPALFQRQVWIGDGNSQKRCLSHQQSPDRTNSNCYKTMTRFSEGRFPEDEQNTLFTSKQIQNSTLKEVSATRKINFISESCQKEEDKHKVRENIPLWGKANSFNLDLRTGRKQSYQGEVHDITHASKFKRASLQDEKPLIDKFYCHGNSSRKTDNSDKPVRTPRELLSEVSPFPSIRKDATKTQNDDDSKEKRESLKCGSTAKNARQNKLLFTREEIAPERIKVHGFGGLGTRLLRRFTAPEFMRLVRDCPSGAGLNKGKIARSETFPLSHTHKIVNSQPSVDSISGVRCEFEGSPPVTRA